jgi:hypothetical protein
VQIEHRIGRAVNSHLVAAGGRHRKIRELDEQPEIHGIRTTFLVGPLVRNTFDRERITRTLLVGHLLAERGQDSRVRQACLCTPRAHRDAQNEPFSRTRTVASPVAPPRADVPSGWIRAATPILRLVLAVEVPFLAVSSQ